jgi:MFS family permease
LGKNFTAKEIVHSLIITKNFWRYVCLVVATLGVRTAYRALDAILPKYMERTLGEGSYYGIVLMINPFATLFFTPIFTPLIYCMTNYSLIIIGSVIVAASNMFPLFESSYTFYILLVLVQGAGEAIFAPRLFEYTISIAPKGKEGSYMAFASVPMFFGALLSGMISGVLLETFCPEGGSS